MTSIKVIVSAVLCGMFASGCGVSNFLPSGDEDEVFREIDEIAIEVSRSTGFSGDVSIESNECMNTFDSSIDGTFIAEGRTYLEYVSGSSEDAMKSVVDYFRMNGIDFEVIKDGLSMFGEDARGWEYVIDQSPKNEKFVRVTITSSCYADSNAD